jgi:hypothetical protein
VATHSQSLSLGSFSQIPVVASKLAVANSLPVGDQATLRIVLLCAPSKVSTQCHSEKLSCEAGFHKRTVLSPEQVANKVFVGCQEACQTRS